MQAYQIQAKEVNGYLTQSKVPCEFHIALATVLISHE